MIYFFAILFRKEYSYRKLNFGTYTTKANYVCKSFTYLAVMANLPLIIEIIQLQTLLKTVQY